MGTWAGEGGNLTDSSYTKPQSTTTSWLSYSRPLNMLKSTSSYEMVILVHVMFTTSHILSMRVISQHVSRHVTLEAAGPERVGMLSSISGSTYRERQPCSAGSRKSPTPSSAGARTTTVCSIRRVLGIRQRVERNLELQERPRCTISHS